MPKRPSILVKGLTLIAVPLLFQLGFLGLMARMRQEGARAEEWTIHSKDVIAQAQRCRVRLLSAHGSIQGYILTRDPDFKADLERTASSVPGQLDELRRIVSDNPGQARAAERLREDARALLDFMIEGRSLVDAGRMDPATAATRRRHSQALLDAVNDEFEAFLAEESRHDARRHELLTGSWVTIDALLIGGGIVSVLCTVLVATLFARSISGRIAGLTENTRRLAEGRALAPRMGGGDEIDRLDAVFHEMARTLGEASRRERLHAEQAGRRAAELDDVNAQLREKAQENEMFVYSVSHDLRSPLVNLQGFSRELSLIGGDLARLLGREGVPPEVRRQAREMIEGDMAESIGFIQTAVSRLATIIDALLRLSRAGRVEYRSQSVEVRAVVARVVHALRGTIEERKAAIKVGELPPAWGDATAIEQVFANLIGNAVNYLDPARPGRISVEAVDLEELDEPTPPGSVVYAVRDNGLGIADTYKDKVFTVFQRLHGDVAKGEGVGLALVRRMVERHGGRVWFESEPGRGTTFFVALPTGVAAPVAVDDGPTPPAEANTGSDLECQPSR